jgi:hypothetical protein
MCLLGLVLMMNAVDWLLMQIARTNAEMDFQTTTMAKGKTMLATMACSQAPCLLVPLTSALKMYLQGRVLELSATLLHRAQPVYTSVLLGMLIVLEENLYSTHALMEFLLLLVKMRQG